MSIIILYGMEHSEFYKTNYSTDLTKVSHNTMMHYDDSFNIFFGTANKDLNWFDNPYISPNVYDID